MNLMKLFRQPSVYPTRINIGCGYDKRPGYLNLDVDRACSPDVLIVNNDLSDLPQGHFEEVLAHDVLEHIPRAHTMSALLDWASLLKIDGVLTFQTSSIIGIIEQMKKNDTFEFQYNWSSLMFGNQMHAGDFHYSGFTDKTLRVYLAAAGFEVGELKINDGWLFSASVRKASDWKKPATALRGLSNEDYIVELYREILRKDADANAMRHWGHQLKRGRQSRLTVLKNIVSSPENLYTLASRMGI